MNKKALFSYKAATIAVLLVIYFMFFSFILYSVSTADEFEDETLTGTKDYYSYIQNKFVGGQYSYCDSPRLRYDIEETAPYELSKANENNLRCDFTSGILNEQTCETYAGCGWENTDNATFWQDFICGLTANVYCPGSGSFNTCLGFINSTVYGVNWSGFANSSQRVSTYHFMDYYDTNGADYQNLIGFLGYDNFTVALGYTADKTSSNVCTHPNVILNKTNCDLFQCTWTTINDQDISAKSTASSLFNVVLKAFTFQYNFGFSNTTLSLLMNLLFIFIPLLILIVSAAYAIIGSN